MLSISHTVVNANLYATCCLIELDYEDEGIAGPCLVCIHTVMCNMLLVLKYVSSCTMNNESLFKYNNIPVPSLT